MTAPIFNIFETQQRVLFWRKEVKGTNYPAGIPAAYVDAYQCMLLLHGQPQLPIGATEPTVPNPDVPEEDVPDIKPCHACENPDVSFCEVSVRPYCSECNHWAPLNMAGSKKHSIEKWNKVWDSLHT